VPSERQSWPPTPKTRSWPNRNGGVICWPVGIFLIINVPAAVPSLRHNSTPPGVTEA
jgi:hypothetical protein